VVFKGRHPRIYNSWRICQDQVNGFSNKSYKGYDTLEEVQEEYESFLADQTKVIQVMAQQPMPLLAMPLEGQPPVRQSRVKDLINKFLF
jgi:hypothetical protein